MALVQWQPHHHLNTIYLSDLANVSTTSLQTNDLLTYNGTNWVRTATSSLGLGDNTFRSLTDTISAYTTGRLLFTDADSVTDSSDLVFVGGNLGIGTTSPYARLSVAGSVVARDFTATSSTSTLRGLTLSNLDCSGLGNNGKLTTDTNGNIICLPDNGGDGTGAAGNTGEVQFNTAGSFTASSNFTWNDTTQTLTVTGTTTTTALAVTGTATSTFAGGIQTPQATTTTLYNAFFYQEGLSDCDAESQTLLYNSTTGTFSCGTDAGSGSSQSLWSTTTDEYAIYPLDTDYRVIVGATATTTDAYLEVAGSIAGTSYLATTNATNTLPYTHVTGTPTR